MRRLLIVASLTAVAMATASPHACAQFSGGFSPERFFGILDRNGDGELDAGEVARMPSAYREWLEDNGIEPPIFEDEFLDLGATMMEEVRGQRESSGFGGFGGFGGPRGDGDREDRSDSSRRGGFRGGSERGSERGRGDWGRGSRSESEPQPKPRERITPLLPSEFAAIDLDGDGQIGLHEWRLAKRPLNEFLRLDLNGDGFLTPRELMISRSQPASSGSSLTAGAGTTGSPGTGGAAVAARPPGSGPPSAVAGTSPATGAPASSSGSSASGSINRRTIVATAMFNVADKNKDGVISEEEWAQSQSTRQRFEQAGVQLTFPLSREKFIELYPDASR